MMKELALLEAMGSVMVVRSSRRDIAICTITAWKGEDGKAAAL